MSGLEVAVALVVALGIVGTVVPLMPGDAMIVGAVLLWAVVTGGPTAWWVLSGCAALVLLGALVKYVVPGRRLRAAGVATPTLACGAVFAVIGFFVVPVVGLVLGFVAGVFVAEWSRRRRWDAAWTSTRRALAAVGLGVLIDLVFALAAGVLWGLGVVLT